MCRTRPWNWLIAGLILAAGCGGRPPTLAAPEEETEPRVPESVTMGGSVIRVADPGGEWKFEARCDRASAAGMDGPYVLAPMEGRYEEEGKPPVLMRADRAEVDKGANRVSLSGSVWMRYGGSQLEADRVEYDLETGEVVAEGRTKWTLTEGGIGAE